MVHDGFLFSTKVSYPGIGSKTFGSMIGTLIILETDALRPPVCRKWPEIYKNVIFYKSPGSKIVGPKLKMRFKAFQT